MRFVKNADDELVFSTDQRERMRDFKLKVSRADERAARAGGEHRRGREARQGLKRHFDVRDFTQVEQESEMRSKYRIGLKQDAHADGIVHGEHA